MTVLLALVVSALASPAPAQDSLRPDLHHGPPEPSAVPNHVVTRVVMPGLHMLGSVVSVSGPCSLESYKVASDTEVDMMIKGNKAVDAEDETCVLFFHKGATQASTYVIVELTSDEQQEKDAHQAAAAMVKEKAYLASLGTQWTVHFADGASAVFTAQPFDPGQLPDFTSSAGGTAKILISDSGVIIMQDACMLSGTITGNQVKDGKSQGSCKHSGAWTAEKK